MSTILIVDEDVSVRRLLGTILRAQGHTCKTAADAREALALLRFGEPVELVLGDARAPGVAAPELSAEVRATYPELPIVVVSGEDDPELARQALAGGADGFLLKPFRAVEVAITVENALHRAEAARASRRRREELEELVVARTEALSRTMHLLESSNHRLRLAQEEIIHRLSIASEYRDTETGAHIYRMSRYSELLARAAGVSATQAELIRAASPLHDVGKIGVSDRILQKPGKHTPAEFELMKQHTVIGYQLLRGTAFPLLNVAATIAHSHHERWDGTGYPRGLAGEHIPLEGRVVAIADVFDALTTKRVYKPAFSVERALEIMAEGRAKHFDPELLDLFVSRIDDALAIRAHFPDISPEGFDFHRLPTVEMEALRA